MTDLFDYAQKPPEQSLPETSDKSRPLAYRMRPRNLSEFVGQEHVLKAGQPLPSWIATDRIPSLIFWGPPGCGKTTLAQIIAQQTRSRFVNTSAILSGVRDIKEAVAQAKLLRENRQTKTILFVDEIHRFNKAQQDALLPHVENGVLTLIGATTENPSFEVNAALLSRCRVIRLKEVAATEIKKVLQRALADPERGLGDIVRLDAEALEWISKIAEGDVRRALTALESIAQASNDSPEKLLGLEDAKKALQTAEQRQPIRYDKGGEEHYNTISAFIKSIRDSDPHAGVYYLARMLEAGEDPLFICRRLVILASEDIGNADPRALQIALGAQAAADFVGMPECRINLAQAVTYLAMAPKSNASYRAIEEALSCVRETGALPIPMHLRNGVTSLMKSEGYGKGYQYAHSNEDGEVVQQHLPTEIKGKRFYHPKNVGLEIQIKEKLDRLNHNF